MSGHCSLRHGLVLVYDFTCLFLLSLPFHLPPLPLNAGPPKRKRTSTGLQEKQKNGVLLYTHFARRGYR